MTLLSWIAALFMGLIASGAAASSTLRNNADFFISTGHRTTLHFVQRRDPNFAACESNRVPSDQSIAGCTRAIESGRLNKNDLAEAYFYRGYEFARTGEPEKAMKDYNTAIEMYPNYYRALFNRAYLHLLKRDYKSMLADAERARSVSKENIDPRLQIYIAKAGLGQGQSIMPEVEDYMKKFATTPEAYFMRAEVMRLLGRPEDAVYDYITALTYEQNLESRVRLAIELSLREMVSKPVTRDDETPGIDSEPTRNRDRDDCETLTGDAAVAACTRAIASKGFSPEELADLMSIRGFEMFRNGDMNGALADFSAVVKVLPDSVFAYEYRGNVYAKLGKPVEARADYERAIANEPEAKEKKRLEGILKSLTNR